MNKESETVFEQLFDYHWENVFQFFAERGSSREECRNLTQETFLEVYKTRHRFDPGTNFERWLYTIATNIWRNKVRSLAAAKRDAPEISLDHLTEDAVDYSNVESSISSSAIDRLITEEHVNLLRKALEELPSQMRRCVLLRIDQNMNYWKIAETMQLSLDAVKSQLFQARELLREKLSDNLTDLSL